MVCPKCGKTIEQGAAFCTGCGERIEEAAKPKGMKVRKQYKSSIYIILDLFAYGFMLGINDFYAGFYKVGLIRLVSTVVGFALGLSTSNLAFLFFPGISALIGFIELFGVSDKAHKLENGRVAFIKPIDIVYDREGTDNYLKLQYGCGLPVQPRKEYSTSVYMVLYFFVGGILFAVNDFYAGYVKPGIFRIFLFLCAWISGIGTNSDTLPTIIIIISCLIGVAELLLVNPRKYVLANGNFAMIRPLDVIYDRRGTEAMLIEKCGCGLQGGKRLDFGTK